MKKNKMMRLASFLLIAVLVSTSAISGTYAKYVTEGSAQDEARVARWGVTITATAEMFSKEYDEGNGVLDLLGVKASEEVVAPGTKKDNAMTFAVKGQPEVDGEITAETANVTLTGWEVDVTDDAVDNPVYYCPLVVTVNGNKIWGLDSASMAEFEAAIEAAITTAIQGTFEAGEDLDVTTVGDMNISWEWPFEGSGHGGSGHANQTDVKDTALGNAAVKATIAFDIAYLIEQVD